jgi:hypothetical protein
MLKGLTQLICLVKMLVLQSTQLLNIFQSNMLMKEEDLLKRLG